MLGYQQTLLKIAGIRLTHVMMCKSLNMCEEIQLNRILTPILLHWTTAIGRSMTVFTHLMLLCHWQLLGDKCKWATNRAVKSLRAGELPAGSVPASTTTLSPEMYTL